MNVKRFVYGLPFMRGYRLARARQIAKAKRLVREGFAMASYDVTFTDDWEREERDLIARLLPGCAALIDVGANYGFYSRLAVHMGKEAIAIEPDEGNLIVLRSNLAGTGVRIFPFALADRDGVSTLYGDGDMASLDADWQGVPDHFARTVETKTLDELLRWRFIGERLFIKIDVEGAEALVLRGARETLARSPRPYWLVESFETRGGNPNPAFDDLHQIMTAAGYSAQPVSHGNILFT